jgi:Domain of unknown function (DUF4272)
VIRRRKRERVSPDQDAVVDRVLCISVVAMLGAIAAGVAEGAMDDDQAAKYVAESHRWLRRENLADALSVRERVLVSKSVGDWTERETIDASWRSESVGVLLWALSAFDGMPAYDTRFETLPALVPLLAPTAEFRGTAHLRSPEQLADARERAELWHWRARTRRLQEGDGPGSAGQDLDAIARQAAAFAYAERRIPEPIDGDFPAYGKAFRALDADEYSAVTSTSAERHYALNWLCGYASDWDSVPTDT